MGIEVNPRYLYVAFFFDLVAQVAGEIAADPLRSDFTTSTRPRPQLATPQYIERHDPTDELLLETAEVADRAERLLAAHLRAFERMQGARRAERPVEVRQRAAEAVDHARSSARALGSLADHTMQVARLEPRDASAAEPREGRPQLSDVSVEARSVLFVGGLRIRDLRRVLRGTNLEDATVAAERFGQSSQGFRTLAEMEAWTPSPVDDLSL